MKHSDIKVGQTVEFNGNTFGSGIMDNTEGFKNKWVEPMTKFVKRNISLVPNMKTFEVDIVNETGVHLKGVSYFYPAECFDLVKDVDQGLSKYKKELLKAIIDNKQIEYRAFDSSPWELATEPLYLVHVLKDEYVRVKPPEPEIRITYTPLFPDGYIDNVEYNTLKKLL